MTTRDQSFDQTGPQPKARLRLDSHDNKKMKITYRRSLPSSSRPTTPVTPPSSVDDLDISPRTVLNKMMLQHSRTTDMSLPALPTKSSLRASRLLATLDSLKGSSEEHRPVLTPAAPHLLYLSSEEDGSSSADDFSDCDLEYATDDEILETAPTHPARMVSVIFRGKPSIIELPRRSSSPAAIPTAPSSPQRSAHELSRTSTEPILNRKSSASSDLSLAYYHSPRTSSTMTNPFDTQRHSFLQTDPFASKAESLDGRAEVPQTSKAATMFKRTFSLVRKRSKPSLTSANGIMSRESVSTRPAGVDQIGDTRRASQLAEVRSQTPRGAQSYHEIIGAARKSSLSSTSSPISESAPTPSPARKLRHGFLSRRKSVKA